MKIEGLTIKFAMTQKVTPEQGTFSMPCFRRNDGLIDEEQTRAVCARAFRKADRLKLRSTALVIPDVKKDSIFLTARAKIAAQEVLRFARGKHRFLREIRFILDQPFYYNKFRKTVEGYLYHVTKKLSGGPYVTVDTIIEVKGGIVLIRRSNPPFGWAIPGGFLDYGETLEEAAVREAKEETGLRVKNLKQLHTYSDPSRDPRFHTVTTVFTCQAQGKPKAGSDAAAARIFKKGAWQNEDLAFDHKKVLEDYLRAGAL